eukprot:Skav212254  [mRNA]  locus=scaffold499:174545:178429:- [translate_table: standard]
MMMRVTMTSCDQDAEIDETLASDLALETLAASVPMRDGRRPPGPLPTSALPADFPVPWRGECAEGTEGGKVTDLNFHYKFLRKIQNLQDFAANLRSLDLSSNNLRVMENFGAMPKLRELKLDACQILRIEGLEKCPSLVNLHLEDNEIACIEGAQFMLRSELRP